MSRTRMTTLTFILSQLFLLDVLDAVSCPLHNLKTVWNIIMILHSYVEQVMTMCRVQELQLTFILSELFPLDGLKCNFVSTP